MLKIFITRMTLISFLILVGCGSIFATEVGKVTASEGRVDILRPNIEAAIPVGEEEAVFVGDSIRTKSNSKVEILFCDKSIVRLAQNSKVTIKEYQLDANGKRETATIVLERGKTRTIIAKMPKAADFNIVTPNAEGKVKGSDIFTFYQAGNSGMLVAEGKLSVVNTAHPNDDITVNAGDSVLIPFEELPQKPRAYLDVEKKVHEQETNVPIPLSKTGKVTVIRGIIEKFSGTVRITNKGASAPHDAKLAEVVGEGDMIETASNGAVEIRLDNNNAISLKPDTKVTIMRLRVNPATGEYENIFEVTIGKVKARVENLKGNSKFELKTPTAVCGARGTLIYVVVTPGATNSFFEGGNGFVTNTLSGNSQNVGAGQNVFSNNNGIVSNPTFTPENMRQGFTEGWNVGSGIEGYSSPEGALIFDAGAGFEGGTQLIIDPDTLAALENEVNGFLIDLPFDIYTIQTILSELMASDKFLEGETSGFLKDISDIDRGEITATLDGKRTDSGDNNWNYGAWGVTLAGTYALYTGYSPTDVNSWVMDVSGIAKDADKIDGCFLGEFKGNAWSGNLLNGKLTGIYLGLDWEGGINGGSIGKDVGSGIILGSYGDPETDGTGYWGAAGGGAWIEEMPNLDTSTLANLDAGISSLASLVSIPITVAYGPVNMSGSGSFTTGGSISATMDMNFYATSAAAQNGIWAAIIQGNYTPPPTPSNSWAVDVGGGGYSATLQGTQWSNGQWRADVVNGVGPSSTTFTGAATGQYIDAGGGTASFNGAGVGSWQQGGGGPPA